MKQIIQDFKTGEIMVLDLPAARLEKGRVLVKNWYSVVSAGTERGTVSTAKKNLIGKAMARPDLVRQVITMARKKGFKSTVDKVKSKLDSLKALGYSSAGRVIDVAGDIEGIKAGDLVACAGAGFASHADIVSVPRNLVARIPDGVDVSHAAFTTIGSIALQGLRQTRVDLGDNIAVIGLGLLGLIEIQLLRAAGARVFGMDIDDAAIERAKALGCDAAVNINSPNIETLCNSFTQEKGFDAVVITASTRSSQPVELAGDIARKKGSVIIVGAVSMDIPRQVYYEKEIDIRLSRSYGPGRYDSDYEEKGIDYPYDYVRWTENRNMQAFLQLLSDGKVDVGSLITHHIPIEEAHDAYDLITGKTEEKYLGVVIQYDQDLKVPVSSNGIAGVSPAIPLGDELSIGFIGAGNFAQTYLLPELGKRSAVKLTGLANARSYSGTKVAEKYQIDHVTTNAQEIFSSPAINTVFIATRHHLHFEQMMAALENGKNVYLEKPLAIRLEDLSAFYQYASAQAELPVLLVGYNRRFSDLVRDVHHQFANRQAPLTVTYRINAGKLPEDHWTRDREIGGGRILGEVCHFVDLAAYLIDRRPKRVFAQSIDPDTVSAMITFEDGSIANIHYLANGNERVEKEYIEVFGEGISAIIQDFTHAKIFSGNKPRKISANGGRDIGRSQVIDAFVSGCRSGQFPIELESLVYTSLTTFMIEESLRTNASIEYGLNDLH